MLQILTLVAALVAPSPVADWTISPQPVLEIHGTWGTIAGVTRLPSGRIFVSDRMSREISIHSAAGSLMATVGGPGSGPGEVRTLNRPLLCGGDSVYFWDSGLGRISIFDADGSYRRSFSDLEVRSLDGRFQGVTDVSCSPAGVFVTRGSRDAGWVHGDAGGNRLRSRHQPRRLGRGKRPDVSAEPGVGAGLAR